jgi:hypothetical protein
VQRYEVVGSPGFQTGPDGESEISGIACRETGTIGRLLCLVADNETSFVQPALIEGAHIIPMAPIEIVRGGAPPGAVGTAPFPGNGALPEEICPGGRRDYREMDVEGVAYDPRERWFYVTASHGCSRGQNRYRESMFVLARLRLNDDGTRPMQQDGTPEPIQATFRLSEVLRSQLPLSGHFGRQLEVQGQADAPLGLNIEGIATAHGRLFIGLRAPTHGNGPYIIDVAADDLFRPAAALPAVSARLARVRVELTASSRNWPGIRDLSVLPDGQLLLLTGPAPRQSDAPFALWALPRNSQHGLDEDPTAKLLGCLARPASLPSGANPEAVAVLGGAGDPMRFLILYDGAPNGGGHEFRLPIAGQTC